MKRLFAPYSLIFVFLLTGSAMSLEAESLNSDTVTAQIENRIGDGLSDGVDREDLLSHGAEAMTILTHLAESPKHRNYLTNTLFLISSLPDNKGLDVLLYLLYNENGLNKGLILEQIGHFDSSVSKETLLQSEGKGGNYYYIALGLGYMGAKEGLPIIEKALATSYSEGAKDQLMLARQRILLWNSQDRDKQLLQLVVGRDDSNLYWALQKIANYQLKGFLPELQNQVILEKENPTLPSYITTAGNRPLNEIELAILDCISHLGGEISEEDRQQLLKWGYIWPTPEPPAWKPPPLKIQPEPPFKLTGSTGLDRSPVLPGSGSSIIKDNPKGNRPKAEARKDEISFNKIALFVLLGLVLAVISIVVIIQRKKRT